MEVRPRLDVLVGTAPDPGHDAVAAAVARHVQALQPVGVERQLRHEVVLHVGADEAARHREEPRARTLSCARGGRGPRSGRCRGPPGAHDVRPTPTGHPTPGPGAGGTSISTRTVSRSPATAARTASRPRTSPRPRHHGCTPLGRRRHRQRGRSAPEGGDGGRDPAVESTARAARHRAKALPSEGAISRISSTRTIQAASPRLPRVTGDVAGAGRLAAVRARVAPRAVGGWFRAAPKTRLGGLVGVVALGASSFFGGLEPVDRWRRSRPAGRYRRPGRAVRADPDRRPHHRRPRAGPQPRRRPQPAGRRRRHGREHLRPAGAHQAAHRRAVHLQDAGVVDGFVPSVVFLPGQHAHQRAEPGHRVRGR